MAAYERCPPTAGQSLSRGSTVLGQITKCLWQNQRGNFACPSQASNLKILKILINLMPKKCQNRAKAGSRHLARPRCYNSSLSFAYFKIWDSLRNISTLFQRSFLETSVLLVCIRSYSTVTPLACVMGREGEGGDEEKLKRKDLEAICKFSIPTACVLFVCYPRISDNTTNKN